MKESGNYVTISKTNLKYENFIRQTFVKYLIIQIFKQTLTIFNNCLTNFILNESFFGKIPCIS